MASISWSISQHEPGADPGFQVRGGALKQIAPSRGRRENCWGISCEKSRFYAKKSYFSNFRRGGGGAREIFGVFHVKNCDFTPKKFIFLPILGGGGRAGCAPLNPPLRAVAHFFPDARTFHNIYKLQKHVILRHQSYLIVVMGNTNLRFWQIMPY